MCWLSPCRTRLCTWFLLPPGFSFSSLLLCGFHHLSSPTKYAEGKKLQMNLTTANSLSQYCCYCVCVCAETKWSWSCGWMDDVLEDWCSWESEVLLNLVALLAVSLLFCLTLYIETAPLSQSLTAAEHGYHRLYKDNSSIKMWESSHSLHTVSYSENLKGDILNVRIHMLNYITDYQITKSATYKFMQTTWITAGCWTDCIRLYRCTRGLRGLCRFWVVVS